MPFFRETKNGDEIHCENQFRTIGVGSPCLREWEDFGDQPYQKKKIIVIR